jgi:hypothetical protein
MLERVQGRETNGIAEEEMQGIGTSSDPLNQLGYISHLDSYYRSRSQ